MNCEQLRQKLYDYLDNSLSSVDKSAAEKHLTGCLGCRETLRRESQRAQLLSNRFEQAVKTTALDPAAQHRIAMAMKREIARRPQQPLAPFWSRLALRFAVASVIVVVAIGARHYLLPPRNSHQVTVSATTPGGDREVHIHVSYSIPSYTFRKEGNIVIDALTCDAFLAEGIRLVKN